MSSRRIGSFVNLSPKQDISINPFSQLDSDSINKLTRIVSNEKDGVLFGLNVKNTNFENNIITSYNIINEPETEIHKYEDITKLTVLDLDYECDLKETKNLGSLVGKNVSTIFHLTLDLISGSPRDMSFSVNDINTSIKYPRLVDGKIKLDIVYNFRNCIDSKMKFKISFVLDPADTYSVYKTKEAFYTGSSLLEFNNVNISFDILNDIDLDYDVVYHKYSDNYPTTCIHPTHKLYISNGIAIKDDTVLDIKGTHSNKFPCLTLDLNLEDNRSWLKNNPYTSTEFIEKGGTEIQYGHIYNDPTRDITLNGTINKVTNKLDFSYKGIVINPLDDNELSDLDYNLEFVIDKDITFNKITIEIKEQSIESTYSELFGTIGYILYKKDDGTYRIIKKIDLDLNRKGKLYNNQKIELYGKDFKVPFDSINEENIKIVSSIGPIKVSGQTSDINKNLTKWAYVVMYYTYFKNPRPNKCYIGLIRESDLYDKKYNEDYVVLAKVRFISPDTVDIISYENRQVISFRENEARNIDYGGQLTVEDRALWIDPDGKESVPTNISDAITKLIKWIPLFIKNDKTNYIINSILFNESGLFEDGKLLIWKWDEEKEHGDIKSCEYSLDSTDSDYFTLAGWNTTLDKIVKVPFNFDITDKANKSLLSYSLKDGIYTINNSINIITDKLTNSDTDIPSSKLLKSIIDGLKFGVSGKNGQVAYHKKGTSNELECDWIFDLNNNTYITTSDTQLDSVKKYIDEKIIPGLLPNIFKDWVKFGHLDNIQYGKSYDDETDVTTMITSYKSVLPYLAGDFNKKYYYDSVYNNSYFNSITSWFYYDEDTTIPKEDYGRLGNIKQNSVVQIQNTTDYSGFISNTKKSNYDITLRCFSNDTDDDMISIVAAFAKDRFGNEHTLSFIRTPNYQNSHSSSNKYNDNYYHHWTCILDYRHFDVNKNFNYESSRVQHRPLCAHRKLFCDEVNNDVLAESHPLYGKCTGWINNVKYSWSKCGGLNGGCLIRTQRKNNIIKAYTTKFEEGAVIDKSSIDKLDYEIEVNLETYKIKLLDENGNTENIDISEYAEILNLFKDQAQYGFGTFSQPFAQFQIYKFSDATHTILDTKNNKTLQYDGIEWVELDTNPKLHLKEGKIYYNSILKSKYWVDEVKNVSCIDSLVSNDNNEYSLDVSTKNTSGKVAVWDEENKSIQSSNIDISHMYNIVTFPDYSIYESITTNGEHTISTEKFPKGAWINFQYNNNAISVTTTNQHATIEIKSSKSETWHQITHSINNPFNAVHSAYGNSGMIPIAAGDSFKLTNFKFNTTTKDIVTIYGML